MSKELIEELRANANGHPLDVYASILSEAADALESQAREIERLKAIETEWLNGGVPVNAALALENDQLRAEVARLNQPAIGGDDRADVESDAWLEKWAADKFTVCGQYKGRVYGNTDWALARALHTEICAALPVRQPLRYTNDGELAECPCCGSLDVGGAHDTVNCYGCGLQITKPRPLQNAADAWNKRAALPVRDHVEDARHMVLDECAPGIYAIRYRDNWDGQGDIYHAIADKTALGEWMHNESGTKLLQYEGDAILAAWLLAAAPSPSREGE